MIILAIDPGVTQCGIAVFDPSDHYREAGIICRSFSSEGKGGEEKCADFGRQLKHLINHYRPDFIAFESARRDIVPYKRKPDLAGARGPTVNADQMLLPEIQGHIRQAAIERNIAFDSVAPRSWRALIYGKGGGALTTDQAKEWARGTCDRLAIGYHNHNEAEAAMIALWGATCSQVYKALIYGVAI
jgi:hypothetical protein